MDESAGDASAPWERLSSGFERARAREDSLDRLVEWPAQRALLGDVTGLAVLDAGCGNGAKIVQLVAEGAAEAVGVDISGNFPAPPPGVELVVGDTMSDLLNTFSAAGLWIETTVEPQLSADAAERFPHKQAVLNKYLGILMFQLRPLGPAR